MNGPLPSVSSLTTAILLKVLADGDARQPVLPPPATSADMSDQPDAVDSADTREAAASRQTAQPLPRSGATTDPAPVASSRTASLSPIIAETSRQLRQTLPAQQPLPATLARLWQMLRSDDLPQVMATLHEQVSDTVKQLPDRQRLSQPDGLRQALQASGVFTGGTPENDGTAAPDLRQLLGRLAAVIRQQIALPAQARTVVALATGSADEAEHATTQTPANDQSTRPGAPMPASAVRDQPAPDLSPATGQSGTASAAATPARPDARQAPGSDARITAYLPAGHGDHTLPGRIQPQARLVLPDSGLLRPDTLGDLADQLQGNVARIDTHRLQALQQMDSGHPQWLVELPVRDRDGIDLWQLHIAREGSGHAQRTAAADAGSAWQVTLSFCFGHSGPMVARLRLQGDNLQVTFHSEQADTWQWLQRHTPTLAASLTAAGLHDVQIRQVAGLPRPETLPQPPRPEAAGLRVQA